MLQKKSSYDEVYRSFRWPIPEYYNIGVDVCDKWADERYRLALIYEDESGRTEKYTFWDIKRLSNRLANAFQASGITGANGSPFSSRSVRRRPLPTSPSTSSAPSPFPFSRYSDPMPLNTAS